MKKRVFISHSSNDKAAVDTLAAALRERGIEPWYDNWEIGPSDDIVISINAGLDEADCGIIVFSEHARDSRWVEAEVSYLTYARVQEGKALIPVTVGEDAWVPPLLRPLARRRIEEADAIADAVLGRSGRPQPAAPPEQGHLHRVLISLGRNEESGVEIEVRIGEEVHGTNSYDALPASLQRAQARFLKGFRAGPLRSPTTAERAAMEASMLTLGRELGALCLPGCAGDALADIISGCGVGTLIEVCFEAEGPELLGLPFEALRLPDDRLLAILPPVVVLRRPRRIAGSEGQPLAGPLKILVAVAAPDEGLSSGQGGLDQERELQNILDAIEKADRQGNAEVRILEVGHPSLIGDAVEADAYHVLHVSCHGSPGSLQLEDEEGRAVSTTPEELLQPIKERERPLPLVLLSACHGAVQDGQTASFAEALLRAGVPSVLAMQTSVSDYYATLLARSFYEHLANREILLPSRALAQARKELERERRQKTQSDAPLFETQPEFATATLFVAGSEKQLADFALERKPLAVRPVHQAPGPVPQLRIDDLIGRRKVLRETLRTLRDTSHQKAGVVLTGIGGVGKSAVAGRAMQRLIEDRYVVPAHAGRFDVGRISLAMGIALVESNRKSARERGERLMRADLDDKLRLELIAQALSAEHVVLVLDDFEQNLEAGGGAFHDPDALDALLHIARSARRGRLLITCRYPIPNAEGYFHRIAIGPLSPAESRKLLLRLPALHRIEPDQLGPVLRVIAGHPRVMEFLDGLLRGGEGRLTHVTQKLQNLAREHDIDPAATTGQLEEGLQAALSLGARDVFLEELVEIARGEAIEGALLQAATSSLPVTPDGVARMLAPTPKEPGDVEAAVHALNRLEHLSLIHCMLDDVFIVHRWTAEGLARIDPTGHANRCIRAGRYRWWRVENETHDLADGIEAVRNFLAGGDYDKAVGTGSACIGALRRFQNSMGIAALAAEILETLPEEHANFAWIADQEAGAQVALGASDSAMRRYRELLTRHERLVQAEPERADYQRELSVSYNKVGDLNWALGQGEQAHDFYVKALVIAKRLADAEPNRTDYQRDLSVSYNKVGDVYWSLGQGEQARDSYMEALAIRQRLAQAEPDRADYQRDLSVSHNRVGDLYRALGQGEEARDSHLQALAIAERLVRAEPDSSDYQRDLSISHSKVGDLYRALGQGEQARDSYTAALAIIQRLAEAEPDRADYQRELSVSYVKIGDIYRVLGQLEQARDSHLQAQAIRERLTLAEPGRADYQGDLALSHERMGDLYATFEQPEAARDSYMQALAIRERLAQAEPDRADLQRELSVSYNRVGDLYRALGNEERAREYYMRDLAIAECLAQAEPDRADYQRDLAVSYNRLAMIDVEGDEGHLRQALAIMVSLREAGKLDPVDEPWVQQLTKTLDERSR